MKLVNWIVPPSKKTMTTTTLALLTVVLFEFAVCIVLTYHLRMAQQNLSTYEKCMEKMILVPKSATINAPLLHDP